MATGNAAVMYTDFAETGTLSKEILAEIGNFIVQLVRA